MKNNLLTKIGLIICSLFMTSCNNNTSWFKIMIDKSLIQMCSMAM